MENSLVESLCYYISIIPQFNRYAADESGMYISLRYSFEKKKKLREQKLSYSRINKEIQKQNGKRTKIEIKSL